MRNYTDVDFTITAHNAHFLTAKNICISLQQQYVKLDIPFERIQVLDDESLSFSLTQEESAKFTHKDKCYIEINYLDATGKRLASNIKSFEVAPNLLREVMHE